MTRSHTAMSIDDTQLQSYLSSILPSSTHAALRDSVLRTLIRSINSIAQQLRSAQQVAAVGSSNAFGDEQLNVDVLAEKIIRSEIQTCPAVASASSEEDPVERLVSESASESASEPDSGAEKYAIAFDPLDGSSIIAPNWTVGTIIGIWEGRSALHQQPAEKQVAAILGVYGPRTTAVVAVRVPGAAPSCFEVGFVQREDVTTCEIVRAKIELAGPPFKARYFAPANLRAAAEDERYFKLVERFIRDKYTLRYSGGLVPDVVHALVKGHGVYISPVTKVSKAKLRRLYELAPIALVIECVGGSAVDPETGEDVLARAIEHCDDRAGLVCGTKQEVDLVKSSLGLNT